MSEGNCEMIIAHHSDCECVICKAHQDAVCGRPTVGQLRDRDGTERCLVCEGCAAMAADDPEAYGVLTINAHREGSK